MNTKERNQDLTLYVGNLDDNVTDALLYELFLQVAPIRRVYIPKDRIHKTHQGYGFVELKSLRDLEYVEKVMPGVKLFNRTLKINKVNPNKDETTAATLFIRNLNKLASEDQLSKIFRQFGEFVKPPRIERDADNQSKGYGFLYFKSYKDSDEALEKMNNQFILNDKVHLEYAFKKVSSDGRVKKNVDNKVERLLQSEAEKNNYSFT
jgi:splicing factor 3B subunit 4